MSGSNRPIRFNGIIGIINIMGHNYLCVISDKEYVGMLNGQSIYFVKNVIMIPFLEHNIPQE